MKKERSDVRYIMWRKKVDLTLLKEGVTPIPNWLVQQWEINLNYDLSDSVSEVVVKFGHKYFGKLYRTITDKREQYKLSFGNFVLKELQLSYKYSYQRLIIDRLKYETFEFLDIEFDPKKKIFYLKDYYVSR
jgi:hypothetical protein